jgi:hypothetical protein
VSFGLSYGVVEGLLAWMFEVTDEARNPFRARLKLMKRLGFPGGVNTGRGRHVVYGAPQLLALAIAVDLIPVTDSTEQAVAIVRNNEKVIRRACRLALSAGLSGEPVFLIFEASAGAAGDGNFQAATTEEVTATLRGTWRTVSTVNLTALIFRIVSRLFVLLEGAETAFRRDLDAWVLTPMEASNEH